MCIAGLRRWSDMATVYQSVLAGRGGQANLQTKTVTAGTSNVTVNPDSGYDGMSQVTVEPTPSEVGAITAGTSQQTAIPTAGKYFSSVTVNPTPSQSKSATPTTSSQTITPDSGKLLSSVSVHHPIRQQGPELYIKRQQDGH